MQATILKAILAGLAAHIVVTVVAEKKLVEKGMAHVQKRFGL